MSAPRQTRSLFNSLERAYRPSRSQQQPSWPTTFGARPLSQLATSSVSSASSSPAASGGLSAGWHAYRPTRLPTRVPIWGSTQRRTMFIQTESTPNADSLKFIPGVQVSPEGTHEFLDAASSVKSPLADKLFAIGGVKTVFYGPDFISVNKDEDTNWAEIKPEIYSVIMEHFTSGQPLFREGESTGAEDTRILDTDSEVVAMIKELLETRVRPAIQEDGGDIEYRGFNEDTGIVQLSLKGSCRGCDSSTVTLKSGIERMLMHYIPEVKEVQQILGPEEKVAIDEFNKFEARLREQGKTVEL